MTAQQAATALAAAVETTPTSSGPENGAQRCIRKTGSTWTSCRCPSCRRSMNRNRKLRRSNLLVLPDASVALDRLQSWIDQGWQASAIASAMGVKIGAAQQIVYRQEAGAATIDSANVRRILRAKTPTTGQVSAAGARRRLQALAWMGWNLYDLEEHTGLPVTSMSRLRNGTNVLVKVTSAQAVAAAYERLQHRPGPNPGATSWARRRGWAPPAAWDEDSIDLVAAVPQGLEEQRKPSVATYVGDDVLDRIAALVRAGLNDREIGYEVGRNAPAVQKLRARHDIRRSA